MDEETEEFEYDGPSKSQLKRDAKALVELGERLLTIPEDQLPQIELPDVVTAILDTKKIKKGNARKRQLQYVGKLLRNADLTNLEHLIARFDASTDEHATKFHQLEKWRERLIEEDKNVLPEIIEAYPDLDRQHIRALVRNAINERLKEKYPPVHFRKLFQYLKTLMDA
ncbi:MAG: ribosome-associated protein [Candidatus Azotimanducaceae bacterium]|jgi:ribosome-associated protein